MYYIRSTTQCFTVRRSLSPTCNDAVDFDWMSVLRNLKVVAQIYIVQVVTQSCRNRVSTEQQCFFCLRRCIVYTPSKKLFNVMLQFARDYLAWLLFKSIAAAYTFSFNVCK